MFHSPLLAITLLEMTVVTTAWTGMAAPFTPGNLAALRVSDGTAPLTSGGTALFLDEYTTNGTLVQSVAIPSTGTNALVVDGTAVADAALTRTPNRRWLCFGGYNTNAGFAYPPGSPSSLVPRAIGILDAAGAFQIAAANTLFYNSNNIRAAVSDGINNFWAVGSISGTNVGGINYYGFDGPSNLVYSINARVLNLINGELYFSTASVTPSGIYKFAGTPESSATPALLIDESFSFYPVSPYGFAFNPAGTLAYVADDRTNGTGGVFAFENSGGTWSVLYLLDTGIPNAGARGLAVDWSGPNPIIYASTSENSAYGNPGNHLIRIVDSYYEDGGQVTTLATAPGSSSFRGVTFVPEAYPLGISLVGNNVAITVPSNTIGAVLESATNLSLGASWTPQWTNSGQSAPSFPISSASRWFFRLRIP